MFDLRGLGQWHVPIARPRRNLLGETPVQQIARESAAAHARSDDERLQQLADAFSRLVDAGDSEARALYRRHQDDALGEDPLVEGACEWPAELDEPGGAVAVLEAEPLVGWRMWAIDGSQLVAPFLTAKWGLGASDPNVAWLPGVNTSSNWHCIRSTFPHAPTSKACRCGIRVVQSKTVLDAFAAHMVPMLGQPAAYARVKIWGQVASYRPEDDWKHTARAEHAALDSALHVYSDYAPVANDLGERYGVDVLDW